MQPDIQTRLLALLAAFVAISVQAQPQAAVELVTKQAIPKNSVITWKWLGGRESN